MRLRARDNPLASRRRARLESRASPVMASQGAADIARRFSRRILPRGLLLALAPPLAGLACALLALPAAAQFLTRQTNLAGLTARAAIIVQGRVLEVSYEGHPDYPNVPTVRVTLEVERMLRGADSGGPEAGTFTFREYLPGIATRAGKRSYQVGQRLFLFLPRASRYGLSSPLGREQGRFRILRAANGEEHVVNDLGNAGLFKNVGEAAAKAGAPLSAEEARVAATPTGPVPLADFVALVERLSRLPRLQ